MKRFIKMMILSALLVLSLGCMTTSASAATKTSVMALKKGKTTTIKSTSKVTSSKKTVASAKKKSSTKYKITAKKAGKTTLKVYNKNGKLSQKIYLLVYSSKTMNYDTSAISLKKGSSKKVQATVPKGCTVKYSSSDKSIAKVNANGKITAVKKGTATIKAKVYYKGEKIKTYKKDVKVKSASTSYKLSSSSMTLTVGDTATLKCNTDGSLQTNTVCTWSTSDSSVVSFEYFQKGNTVYPQYPQITISGRSAGTATITCKTGDKSLTCKVTVNVDSVTANGVSFDMSSFPTTLSVGSSMKCLSVKPQSTIDPADVTYVVANGKAEPLSDYTNPDLYENKSQQYTYQYYVSDWNNMIAYLDISYQPDMYLQYRCEIYAQLKTGSFPVSVYYKGKLLRTCTVTVTETNQNAENWRAQMDEIEANAWTGGMTVKEKFAAIKSYVYDNFSYYDDGAMCNFGAAALLYAARDLGLPARYRFTYDSSTGNKYNYNISGQDEYYHLGMAFMGGHVCTVITIDGKDCIYEAQGHY